MVGLEAVAEVGVVAVVDDGGQRRTVTVTWGVASEVDRVVFGCRGRLARGGQRQVADQHAPCQLSIRLHVGDGMDEEIAAADLELEALVVEAPEVGATTYQSGGH